MAVNDMANRPSVERSGTGTCGPEPEAFRVRDLVVELELDPALRTPGDQDPEATERVWKQTVDEIAFHMARSTSVVVRGCPQQLRLKFSKALMALQFGDLGQRCQWLEGSLYAASQDDPEEEIPAHMVTTLEEFIDQVQDGAVCGNFLDGKDGTPSPPLWATPLFQSTAAWNHTMHLRFSQKGKKKKDDDVEIDGGGPRVIRAAIWTSQGWRLLTHSGYITFPHHDCCGLCTYVVGNAGAKLWAIMRPKKAKCPNLLQELIETFRTATTPSAEGKYSDADIATVCLEEGDVMYVRLISIFLFSFIFKILGFKPQQYYTACIPPCHRFLVGVTSTTTKPCI